MKWELLPPGIIAKSDKGYMIHITGYGIKTFICHAPNKERIGKFNNNKQAAEACEKHFRENGNE